MKILFHCHGWPPTHGAGAEYMAHSIARDLVHRGHEVEALVPPTMLPLNHMGYHLDGVLLTGILNWGKALNWYEGADLVITHLDYTEHVMKLARDAGIPCVHLVHNPWSFQRFKVDRRGCQLAVYNSFWLLRESVRRLKSTCVPSMVVHPPVWLDDYQDPTRPERLAVKQRHLTLLNLADNKGGPQFYELARRNPDRKFLGVEGSYAPQTPSPELPNLERLKHSRAVQELYARTDVLLVPSHFESWGRVAIEAGVNGIPVIAHPTPGLQEALGPAGIFCDRDKPEEWEAALAGLDEPGFYEERSLAVRKRATELEAITAAQLDGLEAALLTLTCRKRDQPRLHFFGSEQAYIDHLAPVWHSLPPEHRGEFCCPSTSLAMVAAHGIPALPALEFPDLVQPHLGNRNLCIGVVASHKDQQSVHKIGLPVARMEHGAGQTYKESHPSYAGGTSSKNVLAMLVPGPHPAAKHALAHPEVPVYEIGCPKLDPWLWAREALNIRPANDPPVVAWAWHWECGVCPETRSGFPYFWPALSALLERGNYQHLGHAHPRAWVQILPRYQQAPGIEVVRSFAEILERADLLCVDNSSVLFEFAAITDRPVMVLNPPFYRRFANHGLRFWGAAEVGWNCWDAEFLDRDISSALEEDHMAARHRALDLVYSRRDGRSAAQAREILIGLLAQSAWIRGKELQIEVEALKTWQGQEGMVIRGSRLWVQEQRARQLVGRRMAVEVRRLQPAEPAPPPPERRWGPLPAPDGLYCCGRHWGRPAILVQHLQAKHAREVGMDDAGESAEELPPGEQNRERNGAGAATGRGGGREQSAGAGAGQAQAGPGSQRSEGAGAGGKGARKPAGVG